MYGIKDSQKKNCFSHPQCCSVDQAATIYVTGEKQIKNPNDVFGSDLIFMDFVVRFTIINMNRGEGTD